MNEIAQTDGLRTRDTVPLTPPSQIKSRIPLGSGSAQLVTQARASIVQALDKKDDKLIVAIGPCSIHDTGSAFQLGMEIKNLQEKFRDELILVFRAYGEKPRTNVGWAGLLHDPKMDGSYNMEEGIRTMRTLMRDLADVGMASTTEILDPLTPTCLADLTALGCIGARTTESQRHRQLVSGASYPTGLKNGTDGELQVAIDGIRAAANPTAFIGVNEDGMTARISTKGNPDTYMVLRGGSGGLKNYDSDSVAEAIAKLGGAGLKERVMIDNSHANSDKKHENQPIVAENVAQQIADGNKNIVAVMIEANWEAGNQSIPYPIGPNTEINPRVSMTDACVSIETATEMLKGYADAVRTRRGK